MLLNFLKLTGLLVGPIYNKPSKIVKVVDCRVVLPTYIGNFLICEILTLSFTILESLYLP